MKKPVEPFKSGNYICQPTTVDRVLKTKVFVHDDIDCHPKELTENYGWEFDENAEYLPWSYSEVPFTMAEMIELSQGLNPSEVRLCMDRDRQIGYIMVSLVHVRPITPEEVDTWKQARDAEDAEYEKSHASYVLKKEQYELWLLKKEVEEKTARLAKLQNRQG